MKLLEEHTSKLKHVFVQRRRAARKSGTKKKSRKNKKKNAGITRCWSLNRRRHAQGSSDTAEPPNEQLQEEWQKLVTERLLRILQGLDELTVDKSDVCPFDALSEVPVDDQRLDRNSDLPDRWLCFVQYHCCGTYSTRSANGQVRSSGGTVSSFTVIFLSLPPSAETFQNMLSVTFGKQKRRLVMTTSALKRNWIYFEKSTSRPTWRVGDSCNGMTLYLDDEHLDLLPKNLDETDDENEEDLEEEKLDGTIDGTRRSRISDASI